MGGAPPLPHDFAPQGGKKGPFLALLAPEDQGPKGAPGASPAGGWGGHGGPCGGRRTPLWVLGGTSWVPGLESRGGSGSPHRAQTLP